ncbi:MAG: VOC family protein [Pseudomonadota bacterium]
MTHGDFVWCDLSTLRPSVTQPFYRRLFGWRWDELSQADGSAYHVASLGPDAIAGLFEMPVRFRDLGLPSFWMSYIAVDDADAATVRAEEHGGRVEVGPLQSWGGARIALIRDPLGAGFTVIEGGDLPARAARPAVGTMAWNALYVGDASAVIPFYEALFRWRVGPASAGVSPIISERGSAISDIHELDESLRGKPQYWAVHFAVAELAWARSAVIGSGGEIVYEDAESVLANDPDGAAFFLSPGT